MAAFNKFNLTVEENITYFGGCPYITEDRSADYTASGTAIDQDIYYRQEEG